jgi:hypothetical protein
LDLKRQLQVIEQEAAILRTKTQTLESDNEKLAAENKQLHLLRLKKGSTETETEAELKGRITSMETELTVANNKVTWCRPFLQVTFFSVIHSISTCTHSFPALFCYFVSPYLKT